VAARLGAEAHGRGAAPDLAECDLLCIATPDAAIRAVCEALAPRLPDGAAVVHFSGATSISVLSAAPGPVACVHPLQTVWPDRGPAQLEGAYAAVTGDWDVGAALARRLGMEPFALADEAKPVYHAATAFASNYVVTLTHVAAGLMERAGLEHDLALRALAPLQHRTVEVAAQPPTGPIARGDAATVAAHLEAIDPGLRDLYRTLGVATLPLVSAASAAAVRDLL
jgi:predicted short-subunit dehydrogenase-like oxidoreductase (DUF2520 family)